MRFDKRLLPAGTKLVIKHFHTGNTDGFPLSRKVHYATRAEVRNKQTGEILAEDWSLCSVNDPPSRKIGTAIAAGRCIKKFVLSNGIN